MWHSLIETLWSTVAYPVSLLLMVAVGYLVAERNYRRHALIWKPLGIESALITICSLLLSFTLLASNNALRGRAVLIHQTSDAVTELHPESQQLPPAYYAAVRAFLLRFLALGLREHRADQPPTAAHPLQLTGLYGQACCALREPLATPTPTSRTTALRHLVPAFI